MKVIDFPSLHKNYHSSIEILKSLNFKLTYLELQELFFSKDFRDLASQLHGNDIHLHNSSSTLPQTYFNKATFKFPSYDYFVAQMNFN